jgi:hypothetical protein
MELSIKIILAERCSCAGATTIKFTVRRMKEVFFTLVKEAKDYIRIRMEDTEKKVCVNIPKHFVRNFDKRIRYAFFDENYI